MTRILLFSSSGDGEEASSSSTSGEGGSSCGGGSGDLSMIAEEEEDEGIFRLTAAGRPSGFFPPLSPSRPVIAACGQEPTLSLCKNASSNAGSHQILGFFPLPSLQK